MINKLKSWLASEDNSLGKLSEVRAIVGNHSSVTALANDSVAYAMNAIAYKSSPVAFGTGDSDAVVGAYVVCARIGVQKLVNELESRAMSNSTNNNDNAAKVSDLDLGEFLNMFGGVKVCDLQITVNELFEKMNECAQELNSGDNRMRVSAQGGIR